MLYHHLYYVLIVNNNTINEEGSRSQQVKPKKYLNCTNLIRHRVFLISDKSQ